MTPRHADLLVRRSLGEGGKVRLYVVPRFVPFAAAALIAAACAGAASAQSLGELAKMEEERRKAIKTPGKVYTNDSIRQEPGSAAPGTPASAPAASAPASAPSPSGVQPPAAPGAQQPAATEPTGDEAKKDQAYWKQRIEAARDALQRAQIFAEALQSRINALSADWAARDDPAQRDVLAMDRQKALAELDRVKQEIDQHNKTIAGIQDEARRAGVPPGWLR